MNRIPQQDASAILNRKIGENIRRWRRERGVSQKQLAAAMGCSFQQVQKYELGMNRISVAFVMKAADLLNVPVLLLLDDSAPDPDEEEVPRAKPVRRAA